MPQEHGRPATRAVGEVVALTPSGSLTVRAPGATFAGEGTRVVDRSGSVRGEVVGVFGPVARPYLRVRPRRAPTAADGVQLLGAELYRE